MPYRGWLNRRHELSCQQLHRGPHGAASLGGRPTGFKIIPARERQKILSSGLWRRVRAAEHQCKSRVGLTRWRTRGHLFCVKNNKTRAGRSSCFGAQAGGSRWGGGAPTSCQCASVDRQNGPSSAAPTRALSLARESGVEADIGSSQQVASEISFVWPATNAAKLRRPCRACRGCPLVLGRACVSECPAGRRRRRRRGVQ
jgi:hypothetical protein